MNNLKKFGIYTSTEYGVVSIIIEQRNEKIIGVDIGLENFQECTNVEVNNYIFCYTEDIEASDIFAVSLNNYPDLFKDYDYGYLGQVDDYLRDDLEKQVKQILGGISWFFE